MKNKEFKFDSSNDKENPSLWKGHSEKKIHEVRRFTQFIDNKLLKTEDLCIVDIGSGLGYLDEKLLSYGFDVIGIECNEAFHKSAIQRHKKESEGMNNSVTMKHLHMNFSFQPDCVKAVEKSISDEKDGCLVALHACGDLTNQIIKTFIHSEKIRSLAVVSCCYHKMNSNDFPISQKLKEASVELNVNYFNHFFLRLGANEPLSRWMKMSDIEHIEHSNNVLFRSVLEMYSKQVGLELKKKRRKATKKSEIKDFVGYVDNLENIYDLSFTEQEKMHLQSIYETKRYLHKFVENLTGLQFLVQQVIEQLILADRKEQMTFE